MSSQNQPSLYERLGGIYSIATVVDDLIDRVMADPRLNANPAVDEAHHRVPPAGFKYLATELVCWAAGGPQTYTGRSMADSHRHLRAVLDCLYSNCLLGSSACKPILWTCDRRFCAPVINGSAPNGPLPGFLG
jgi:hypothetical protein